MFAIVYGYLGVKFARGLPAADVIYIWYVRTARGKNSKSSHMIRVTMRSHL